MHMDFTFAPWGMAYAALMYVLGNGVWTNHLVRHKPWLGWLMWTLSAVIVIVIGAVLQVRISPDSQGVWSALTSVNKENHWIVVTLYALLSVPGAASVLFRQSLGWTRLGVLAIALIVFIPLGMQLHDPNDPHLMLSLGLTLAICGLSWLWSALLDCEPAHQRKTVPIAETDQ